MLNDNRSSSPTSTLDVPLLSSENPPLSSDKATNNLIHGDEENGSPDIDETHLIVRQQQQQQEEGITTKSKNIPITLAYSFISFAGRSMWNTSILPAFVFLLRDNDAEAVGLLTAIMGLSQLMISFPSGIVADKYRRDITLKVAAVVGLASIVTTSMATYLRSYVALAVALSIWGLYWGMSNPSISAIFADSVLDGERSRVFTRRMILQQLGVAVGPLVTIVMFLVLGDEWKVEDCAMVMIVAQGICLPSVLLIWFLNDDYTVVDSHPNPIDGTEIDTDSSHSDCENEEIVQREGPRSDVREFDKDRANVAITAGGKKGCCYCIPRNRIIPAVVAISDMMTGLASGMSIRYFPIFFLDNLKLSPVMVQVLYMLAPVGQAILGEMARWGSKKIGRCQMTVLHKWIGISFMFAMVAAYKQGFSNGIICLCYMIRTCFMNSTYALTTSVIMDTVPKNERAKWSALESVNMFSWAGSAALGGVLVGTEGIIFNFYVTAALQFAGSLPLVALFNQREVIERV